MSIEIKGTGSKLCLENSTLYVAAFESDTCCMHGTVHTVRTWFDCPDDYKVWRFVLRHFAYIPFLFSFLCLLVYTCSSWLSLRPIHFMFFNGVSSYAVYWTRKSFYKQRVHRIVILGFEVGCVRVCVAVVCCMFAYRYLIKIIAVLKILFVCVCVCVCVCERERDSG
jgi:hypothetical protein